MNLPHPEHFENPGGMTLVLLAIAFLLSVGAGEGGYKFRKRVEQVRVVLKLGVVANLPRRLLDPPQAGEFALDLAHR
jgi:hypothetical protein